MESDHGSLENPRTRQGVLPDCEVADVGKATMRTRMVNSAEQIASRFLHAERTDTWAWSQSGINTDSARERYQASIRRAFFSRRGAILTA